MTQNLAQYRSEDFDVPAELPHLNGTEPLFSVLKPFDSREFRTALGRFPTGVTVLATLDESGERVGVTISSFTSVSLEPPLILWCLSKHSPNLEAFRSAAHYSVNVLAADQQEISERFASCADDRFANLSTHSGIDGVPLLEGCCVNFECANEMHHDGGDHLIFIGRVVSLSKNQGKSPLVFHDGRYCKLLSVAE